MATSRPNAANRTRPASVAGSVSSSSSSRAAADGGPPRSPLGPAAAARQLAGQLGAMSVGGSKGALVSSPARLSRPRPKASSSSSSSSSLSKAQQQAAPSTSKTPSRKQSGTLSKSAGPSTSAAHLLAAGGLGRMDIVAAQDWPDARSSASTGNSSSAGSSPRKSASFSNSASQSQSTKKSAKKYDRFIPSRENSHNAGATSEESIANARRLEAAALVDDSFERDAANASNDAANPNDAEGGFDDSPPPTPHRGGGAGGHTATMDHSDQAHTAELSSSLGIELGKRILSFASEPPPASTEHSALLAAYARGEHAGGRQHAHYSHQTSLAASARRRIATTPERVLDAPGLLDDYYLNLLDWSSTNLVAIALAESVYIWNAESGEVGCLCSVASSSNDATDDGTSEEVVCSVRFSEDGSYLAVGTSSGPIQIYDLSTSTRIRTMSGHATRVPSLSWSGAILASGSRDGSIWNSDVRVAQHKVAEMKGHRAEVCGLEWRKDTGLSGSSSAGGGSAGGMGLLASGGNDNVVNVWDGRMLSAPKMVKTNHTAAVKAIAWCPWQSSLLATGGGSSDRTIHFWNTTTSARLNSLVTPSQVTSLAFNPHSREILSSHGFPDNQLSIWTYPTLSKVVDITQAHETRVLHSCLNPDGTTIATASSDENLKFWKVFDLPKKSSSGSAGAGGAGQAGKGYQLGEGKNEHDVGRRGRTGLAIR